MIETILLNYLNEQLDDPVKMEKPSPPPDRYYLLEKTGGGMENRIFSATFVIQSYAPTLYEAAEMNEAAKAAMLEADTLSAVSKTELNSDYNYTDTANKGYCYQAVFDIIHY